VNTEDIAAGAAMIGSVLVASSNDRHRLLAFTLWCGTNTAFLSIMLVEHRYSMAQMYAFFLCTCLLGIWNNRGPRPL